MTTTTTKIPTVGNGDQERRTRLGTARWFDALCGVLAATFVLGGVLKYLDIAYGEWSSYGERFVDWGYPSWVRIFVGTVELVGAALLVKRRTRVLATGLLLPILIGAVTTHIVNNDPLGESVMAPTVLALLVFITWVSAPWHWGSS